MEGQAGEVKVEVEVGEEEVTGEVEDSISTSMETEVRAKTHRIGGNRKPF